LYFFILIVILKFKISYVSEKRCEITLFISFHQIFEQKFTKIVAFLSFCQLRIASHTTFGDKDTKKKPHFPIFLFGFLLFSLSLHSL